MCGRYHITRLEEEIINLFGAAICEINFINNFNAAPSQLLPVIANNEPNKIQLFRWGLIPHWAKDESIGNNMINARIETLKEKPSFKSLVDKKRCVILTDGYYEWQKLDSSTKQPMRICKKDESFFAYAGLWSEWIDKNKRIIPTFTIITTEAYQNLAEIHNRMPVMLNPEIAKDWLANEIEVEQLQKEMISSKELTYYPVSKGVNNPKNNNVELIQQIEFE